MHNILSRSLETALALVCLAACSQVLTGKVVLRQANLEASIDHPLRRRVPSRRPCAGPEAASTCGAASGASSIAAAPVQGTTTSSTASAPDGYCSTTKTAPATMPHRWLASVRVGAKNSLNFY